MIPGAFEGETVTRRRFMTGTAHTAGAIAAASFTLPALGFAIGPIFKQPPHFWEDIGTPEDFTDNNYIPVVITIAQGIGEAGKSTAYVRKHNARSTPTPTIALRRTSRSPRAVRISAALCAGSCRRALHLPVPRWRLRPAGSACRWAAGQPLDRFLTRVRGRPVQAVHRALLRQQRAQRFSPARPGRAARRHRPVPVSISSLRAQALDPVPKLPSSPLPPDSLGR